MLLIPIIAQLHVMLLSVIFVAELFEFLDREKRSWRVFLALIYPPQKGCKSR